MIGEGGDVATTGDSAAWGNRPARLVLEDGSVYEATAVAGGAETFGEVVFNTSMTGYQEVLTDPSYRGQIVVMTYPEVGIYGVNDDDVESAEIQVSGFVVHRAVRRPSNHRATASLPEYLAEQGIALVEGVDTRALTRRLRSAGAMRGVISSLDRDPSELLACVRAHPSLTGRDLASEASRASGRPFGSGRAGRRRLVLVDGGAKESISRWLERRSPTPVDVVCVRCDTTLDAVLEAEPCGVVVSNGPGDPAPVTAAIDLVRGLLERQIPLAGICLGHQILALALGGTTYKMTFGHRGTNHPVRDATTGRTMITSQNHGFAVDPTSLGIAWSPLDRRFVPQRPELLRSSDSPGGGPETMAERLPAKRLLGDSPLGFGPVEATHLSLNDGTLEGLRLLDRPAMSVQFHPEASPGPHDAREFFDRFWRMAEAHRA